MRKRVISATNHPFASGFQCPIAFSAGCDAKLFGKVHACSFGIKEYDLRQREGMDRTDESSPSWLCAERGEPCFELTCAFIVGRDAREASWFLNVFGQKTCQLDGQGLCLPATGSGKDNTVSLGFVGWANANCKCNGFNQGGHFFGHGFGGCFPTEGFSGAVVHQGCDVVEPGLAGIAEIGAFGDELAQEAVCVLVAAALPGACGSQNQMSTFSWRASSGWQAISNPRS